MLPAVQLVEQRAAREAQGGGGARAQDVLADMRARGRCWALVGAARLALVAPAAGTDPARKAAMEQQRLRGFVERELQPELEVSRRAVTRMLCPQNIEGAWILYCFKAGCSQVIWMFTRTKG